ncbi:MAG: alkaline phosphatase family protein [Clostridia bacterium]|nr:alkaline phosphatase family protein [Clostridia bacterium]
MKNNKKIIISIVSVVVVLGIIAGALAMYFTRYHKDKNDTEEMFRQNVASVGYENTVETAYPQTDLYGIIKGHFESELPEGKTEKKVVIIGYDGCRADILAEKQEQGAVSYLIANGASNNLTYCGGVNYPAENTQDTSTAPGWCSIATGEWADIHGITGNGIVKEVEPKTLMTSLVESGTIDSSSFITKWKGHFSKNNSTYLAEKEYCEKNNIAVKFELRENLEDVHTGAMAEITDKDCSDFVFIIYEDTDSAGHDYGFSFNNPVYKEGFKTEDAYGYEVIKAIEARESYETEDWLIIVTSDHGGIGTGHGGSSIQERMTFVVMNKEWN